MGLKSAARRALAAKGIDVRRVRRGVEAAVDPVDELTIEAVRPYTMTTRDRLITACEAVRYIHRFEIPGAVVECGVWAGGSSMAMARTLLSLGDASRELYLFDTFEGMSAPTDVDKDPEGISAAAQLASASLQGSDIWAYSALPDVQRNLAMTGYPMERCHFVKGKVEETVPGAAPATIALLRLDTDWYESTKHELDHLIGRVSPYGLLIIDDYGYWQGARKAVDEWLSTLDRPVFLSRIDNSARVAVLP